MIALRCGVILNPFAFIFSIISLSVIVPPNKKIPIYYLLY